MGLHAMVTLVVHLDPRALYTFISRLKTRTFLKMRLITIAAIEHIQ